MNCSSQRKVNKHKAQMPQGGFAPTILNHAETFRCVVGLVLLGLSAFTDGREKCALERGEGDLWS